MRSPLFAAALAATALLVAGPAGARDRDYRDRDYRETSERDTMITPNQIVDMADARVAQFKADLRLNPDQDRNWNALQSALHDMALRRADRMTKARERAAAPTAPAATSAPATTASAAPPAKDATVTPPAGTDANTSTADQRDRDTRDRGDSDRASRDRSPDIVAVMRRQAETLTDRADDYRKFADASGPLYGSLDDGQKRRFLAFVQRNLMEEPEGPAYRR